MTLRYVAVGRNSLSLALLSGGAVRAADGGELGHVRAFDANGKKAESFALRAIAGPHHGGGMLPAIGRGTIGDQKPPWTVVAHTSLPVDGPSGLEHCQPLRDRRTHRRVAGGGEGRWLEEIGCLEVG